MTQDQEHRLADKYGAARHPDEPRGVGWSKYLLNGWWVWFCARGWARAQLIDNHYRNHAYHPTLEQAFKAVSETK